MLGLLVNQEQIITYCDIVVAIIAIYNPEVMDAVQARKSCARQRISLFKNISSFLKAPLPRSLSKTCQQLTLCT